MPSTSRPAWRRALVPSLSDCLFATLLVWLFLVGSGWSALLADGDTGWHIRAGEYILDHHHLPETDPFSFSKAGQKWYAWEWLSDVAFAWCFRLLGLKGVVLLSGVVIVLSLMVVFQHMLARGSNAFVALAVCLLSSGASGIHYLARPHIFTLLLLAVSLRLLERDRAKPGYLIWLLVPITALWTNLHGGFLALPACLVIDAVGGSIEVYALCRSLGAAWQAMQRKLAVLVGCALATLANPYGIGLHEHISTYLKSDWIREAVDEFQSPKFRSESALYFEILLFAGLLLAGWMIQKTRVADTLLVLLWAHAALISVRHVPLFAVAAGPIIASEASALWTQCARGLSRRSIGGILHRMAEDFAPAFRGLSIWTAALVLALAYLNEPIRWPRDFPEIKFPTAIIGRQAGLLVSGRVFTSDQWGDYLIYKFHPRVKVYIDGRSDFYGPALGKQYLRIAYAGPQWREDLASNSFNLVLAPPEWPLAGILTRDPEWKVVDRDARAVLLRRVIPPPN